MKKKFIFILMIILIIMICTIIYFVSKPKPTNNISSPQNLPQEEILKDVIIGIWNIVGASDKDENTINDWSNNPEWGTHTRYIEIRFDSDGKFYQRRWTNNTGNVEEGEDTGNWNNWEYEGTYVVQENNITFKLNDSKTDQILFWKNGQTEKGIYSTNTNQLQYNTNYYEGGDVVHYYFEKQ